jgi:hypothetical protein
MLQGMYKKFRIGKHLSDNFPIQNGLKQGDAFRHCFSTSLWKVQDSQVELKLNGTHQMLLYADDVDLQTDNIDTIKKNTRTLVDAGKEVGLEVNTEKTKYMLLSRHQNAGQNCDIKIGNRSFENVVEFKYLGTNITDQNLIQEEIKRRLNSGNVCYHSVQNILLSRLLSKNIKITIYKSISFPLVLYMCNLVS